VTNCHHATHFAISCRLKEEIASDDKQINTAVVIIERERPGILLGTNYKRMGVHGVTLAPL
jgi:hypothetical protein